ncbi:hypothetical protein [Kribbella sp. NPDC049227]|uniref:hypothetical protein n=1 Tax=Kribbella sp. NPDC049227 TaxID=3364113 RepID=UPI00371B5384
MSNKQAKLTKQQRADERRDRAESRKVNKALRAAHLRAEAQGREPTSSANMHALVNRLEDLDDRIVRRRTGRL